MLAFPGMQDAMDMFLDPCSNPYTNIIRDYVTSWSFQTNPDPKLLYEAIIMAVNQG